MKWHRADMHRGVVKHSRLPALLIFGLGWVCFITSFFLPATNVLERGGTRPGTPMVGWDAAISSVTTIGAQPLILIAEPKSILFLLFPLVNLMMLLSPAWALGEPESAFWLAIVLLPIGICTVGMPATLIGDVFAGFYLWVGSFFVVSVGCIVLSLSTRRTLSGPVGA